MSLSIDIGVNEFGESENLVPKGLTSIPNRSQGDWHALYLLNEKLGSMLMHLGFERRDFFEPVSDITPP